MSDYDHLLVEESEDELRARPIDEVRATRDECKDVETGLSYLRRLVQGPLDIAQRERDHRDGGTPGDLGTLVDELPDILTEHGGRGDGGRLPQQLAPARVDADLEAELQAILDTAGAADIPSLDDAALDELVASLSAFEGRVSALRKAFFGRIDALNGELARRYRTGEASVDDLLG